MQQYIRDIRPSVRIKMHFDNILNCFKRLKQIQASPPPDTEKGQVLRSLALHNLFTIAACETASARALLPLI